MKKVSTAEVHDAFGFLLIKVMNMELKTPDGNEICPMFGFCDERLCNKEWFECFLDRYMESYPEKSKEIKR